MKTIKKIALVSIASVLFVSGCSNPTSQYNLSTQSSISENVSSDLPFDDLPSATEPESPYIDYLGTKSLTKTDGYILYYGNYGQNAQDKLVKQEFVTQSSLASRLTERIASDLSPDLCEKPDNAYYLITKNLFEDLTKYIDVSAPQWEEYSEYLNAHKFKNGNYFYPTSIKQSPYFLAYDQNQIKSYKNGNKTPIELWNEGSWNYEAFSDIVSGTPKIYVKYDSAANYDLFNYKKTPMECLLISSGNPLFDTGLDGQLSANLSSDKFFDEISFIGNSISDCIHSLNGISNCNFISLNDEQLAQLRKSDKDRLYPYDPENLVIVPYPLSSDGKYYGITEGYLVPKRAKNIKAAASFINGSRIAARINDYPEGLTENDRAVLTELRSQSYAKMIESYDSYVDADTKLTADNLWKYETYSNIDKNEFIQYEPSLTKALTEFNQNIR